MVAAPPPSDSAVRMLELAQRTADEHVARAKAESDQIVAGARQEAERVTADLRREQMTLEARVEELKAFEREYRTRLRSYLRASCTTWTTSARSPRASRSAAPTNAAPAPSPTPGVAPLLCTDPVGGAAGSGPDTLGGPARSGACSRTGPDAVGGHRRPRRLRSRPARRARVASRRGPAPRRSARRAHRPLVPNEPPSGPPAQP